MSPALLKTLILFVFVAMLASLSSALFYLFKDTDDDNRRTLYALGTRIALSTVLVALVVYGVETGKLSMSAPWSGPPTSGGS